MIEKTPTAKRPITLDDIHDIDYIDAYKKIEVVGGDWNMIDEMFYRSHGGHSGSIQAKLIYFLLDYVDKHALGHVYSGSVGFVLKGERNNIQLMRRTDVSFVKAEHLKFEKCDEPFYRAPDLAVEVVWRDFADDMFQRIQDFLVHGTEQVWVVAPSPRQIWVYLPDGTAKRHDMGDTISADDLLPGFELVVATVFEGWDN